MQRRRQGRVRPDRAVGKEIVAHARRGEHERDRGRGEEVIDADRRPLATPASALPGDDARGALEKGYRLAGGVAGRIDRDGTQLAVANVLLDARAIELGGKPAAQGRVVQ